MRRRIAAPAAALVVVLAALLALAGCVTIPTGGGVTTQRIEQDQGGDGTIRAVSGPDKGMTPSEIVAGFVRAGGGPQSAYQVAKEYLTSALQSKWKPGAFTLISDTPVAPEPDLPPTSDAADFSVGLDVVGQIDATGVYTAQSVAQRVLSFHLVKQKGQWRIDRAPDGTVLRTRDLGSIARPYDLYFFDPGYDYLVPDLRWFADQGGDGNVQRIVGALLAGPAPWLASPVVVSAFPSGTQLGGPPVVDSGEITVDLNSAVADAGALQQARMLQQLTWSLRALDVHAVSMTASGLALPATEGSSANGSPSVTFEAVGSDGKVFGSVGSTGVTALPSIGDDVQALAPTAVTLGHDRTTAAVLGAGGVSLVTPQAHAVVDARSGLLAPALDPEGYVWSAQADPGSLIAVREGARPHPAPLTLDGRLVSIAMSRDGTRLLVGLATDTGARLVVLGVQRDKDGSPTGFGTPLEVPIASSRAIIDAAWVDSGSVAVISGDPTGVDEITEYELGGLATSHGVERAARSLAAGASGSGFDAIRVLLACGQLDQPSLGDDWQATGAKLTLLATQQ
jgi:hypothetical protein